MPAFPPGCTPFKFQTHLTASWSVVATRQENTGVSSGNSALGEREPGVQQLPQQLTQRGHPRCFRPDRELRVPERRGAYQCC